MIPLILAFDYALFQAQIPQYATSPPESVVAVYWSIATFYVSKVNFGSLHGDARQYAINLCAAHLIYLSNELAAGQVPYIVQNATIDKISVALVPPPTKTLFQWWLSTSPYGAALLALLQIKSVGGFYIGGSAPVAALGGPTPYWDGYGLRPW